MKSKAQIDLFIPNIQSTFKSSIYTYVSVPTNLLRLEL